VSLDFNDLSSAGSAFQTAGPAKYNIFYFGSFEMCYNVCKFIVFYAFLQVAQDTGSCAD